MESATQVEAAHSKSYLKSKSTPDFLSVCACFRVLTFADAGSVHHPDEGGAVLAVGGDAVLRGLEDVAVVFFHLQGAAETPVSSVSAFVLNTKGPCPHSGF